MFMTMATKKTPNHYNATSIRVKTPDGTMTVFITEDETGNPFLLNIFLGKAGTSVAAWAAATATLCSALLESRKSGISDLVQMMSGITSARSLRLVDGISVSSGPEGLVLALMKYRDSNFAVAIDDDDDDYEDNRPARIGLR